MVTTTAATPTHGSRPAQRAADGAGQARPAGADTGHWLSLLGGGALAAFGLARGSLAGLGLAALGGALAYRGAAGRSGVLSGLGLTSAQSSGLRVEEALTIQRPREELFRFWRDFENLPRFMEYLESVRTTGGNRSHWVARGPLDVRVAWDAEITAERPNELIAWRALPGSAVDTEGEIRFTQAPGNRGTRVHVRMRYDPPGGKVGAAIAWLFGRSGEQAAREDLRRFKRLLETGEIPTTRGQPSGRGREAFEQTGEMVVQENFADGLGWFAVGLGTAQLLAPEAVANVCGTTDHHTLMRLLGARELATGVGILTQMRPTGWLWARVLGDAMDLGLLTATLLSPHAKKARTLMALASVLGVTAADLICSLKHSASPDVTADGFSPDGAGR